MHSMHFTRVTIVRTESNPDAHNLNDLLLWLGASLGLFNPRDKDKSCYRIFVILLKQLKLGEGITSDDIALKTGLTRGTVVHHLNRLMDAGLVVSHRGKYALSVDNLEEVVENVRIQVNKTFDRISSVAKFIDKNLNN